MTAMPLRMFLSSQSRGHRGQNCLSWFDLKERFTYFCLEIEVKVFPKDDAKACFLHLF